MTGHFNLKNKIKNKSRLLIEKMAIQSEH